MFNKVYRIIAVEHLPQMVSYIGGDRGWQFGTPATSFPHPIVRRIVNLAGSAPTGEAFKAKISRVR